MSVELAAYSAAPKEAAIIIIILHLKGSHFFSLLFPFDFLFSTLHSLSHSRLLHFRSFHSNHLLSFWLVACWLWDLGSGEKRALGDKRRSVLVVVVVGGQFWTKKTVSAVSFFYRYAINLLLPFKPYSNCSISPIMRAPFARKRVLCLILWQAHLAGVDLLWRRRCRRRRALLERATSAEHSIMPQLDYWNTSNNIGNNIGNSNRWRRLFFIRWPLVVLYSSFSIRRSLFAVLCLAFFIRRSLFDSIQFDWIGSNWELGTQNGAADGPVMSFSHECRHVFKWLESERKRDAIGALSQRTFKSSCAHCIEMAAVIYCCCRCRYIQMAAIMGAHDTWAPMLTLTLPIGKSSSSSRSRWGNWYR